MYASKRHSYTPPTYKARNLLAALDNNAHAQRQILTNKDGSTRLQRIFQKKSNRWTVTSLKTEKRYDYIPEMLFSILDMRLHDDVGMQNNVVLEYDDPRILSAHLAPIPPPPTREIAEQQKSRFSMNETPVEDPDRTIDYVYQPEGADQ